MSTEIARRCRPRLQRCPPWSRLPAVVTVARKYDGIAAVVVDGEVWTQTHRIRVPTVERAFAGVAGPVVVEIVDCLDGRERVSETCRRLAHDPASLCAVVLEGDCPRHAQVQRAEARRVRREDLPDVWDDAQCAGWEGLVLDSRWKKKATYTADLVALARCLGQHGETVGVLVGVARRSGAWVTVGEVDSLSSLDTVASIAGPPLVASSGAQYDWITPTPVEVEVDPHGEGKGWDLSAVPGSGLVLVQAVDATRITGRVLRMRGDKTPDRRDCGPDQLGLDLAEPVADPPVVVRGEVVEVVTYFREYGDDVAVRKWLLIHNDRPGFHPWVVHHTDYSPTRSERLRRTVRTADSLEAAQEVMDAWVASSRLSLWSCHAG
jgi:hypothetical protein